MSYLHRWFGSKANKNTKSIPQKFRDPQRLHIEQLEARINPTDVVVSSLLFRGDLVADGALWKATGKPIEVGFNPTGTEAFRSLVTLTGDAVIDPVQTLLQFKGTGSFPSALGQVDFWSSTSLSSFDIQKMVAGGETIQPRVFAVAGLDFQPGKLLFENPNGGSTEDSRLAAQGSLQFSQLPGFSLAVDGSNQVLIDPAGVTLTGIAASLSGDFKAAGATFTGTKLVAAYSSADQSFSVQGASTIAFGTNSAVVKLGDASIPGLVIRNGQLATLDAGLTGTFQVAGAKVGLNALKFSYDTAADSISLTGSSSLAFGTNSAALSLNNKGLVIRSGAIENLDATVDGKLQVAGSDLRLNKLTVTYARAEDLLRITGSAQLSIGVANPSLDFGTKGLVIQGGAVQSFFATLDGSVSAAGASLVFSGISVYYSKVDSEFSLSNGTASFTLGSNKASVSLGERGLVVKSGEIESVDATFNGNLALAGASLAVEDLTLHYTRQTEEFRMGGAVRLAFGGFNLDAALAPDNGLVIRSGAIESVDAKVNGSVTLAGAKVTLTDTAITYSRADDRLTAQGKLAFTYEANSFSVALRNTGLIIEKGQITSLDGVADGKVQIADCSAALNQLGVSYNQADSRLQLTGGASVTIGQSSVAFEFLADKGGLVIQNGALASINATAKGVVVIEGNEFKLDTVVSYSAPESFLECSGAISASLADGTKLSAAGLVRLKDGAVQKVVAKVGGDITVAGVTIRANELSFTYEASGSVTGLRISMPQGSGGQPSLKIIIPSGVAGQADTEINVPSLDIAAGLRITNGVLESFTLQISGAFEMKGIKILVDQVSISYSTDNDTVISIQGAANVELEKFGVAVTLGKKDGNGAFTTPGIKLVNGAIDTVDISIAGNLKVGNGFELLSVDAGLIYIPQGQYKDILGSNQTGPVWGVYGNLSPLGWKFAPTLAMGTRDKPAILFHAGKLVDGGAITANFSTRFGPFTLDGVAALQPVAADTYIESNGTPGWQQGETLLVDQNNNGTADSSHFIITAKAKLAIPFWKRVYADLEFDTSTSALSRIAISVPTRMAIPGTPLVMTALAGTVENLDNPSNLSIKAQIGLSVFSASDLVTIASKLDNYYENYLDLQVLGTTDGGVSLPDLPSLPTFTPAHFTGEVSYSPGKLVITADAYLFAMGTRYTGDDVFRRADGDWTGLVEATGKIYLDWANSRYYASLNASALGGIFRANALLGMDFAQDIYVVEAGATLDVEGTAMDFAPLSWVTPVGAQFIVLISPSEKFVGGWVDTPFGPAGVGYNFSDNDVEFIGKTKVKSLRKIAERITAPSVPVSVPVDQRKFNTNFTFNYTVADIEVAGGLPLSESNSITLTTSFQILDDLAYERTDSETRKFPNFIAPGSLSSPCSVYTAFSGSMIENTITDTSYTILPGRFSGDASPNNGMREGAITVTIYPFKLSPGSDYNALTGELTAAGREKVRLNSTKTFDKSLFSGGNLATITLRSNTPAIIVNDKRVAKALTQQALPVPPQGSEPITPTWLKVNDKNYWIDPAYTVTYPLDTVTLDPVTGSTSTSTRQVSKELGLEMTVIKGVTPPAPTVTPGTASTVATQVIDHHTNSTSFQTTSAPVGSTAAGQTSVSLVFASQADAASYRWQALVTGDESPVSGGGQAPAVLYQIDSISPTELLAGQVSNPVTYDYLKESALSRSGTPLLFISQENGVKVVRQGVVDHWTVNLQGNGKSILTVSVIPDGQNGAITLPASAVKPAWLPKANILLNRSTNEAPLTRGSTFTAAVVDGKPQGATSDLAIFRVVDSIRNGQLPPLPAGTLDAAQLVLNPLPAGVSRQVNSRLLAATSSEIASSKWLFNTLDSLLQPVTVTGFGDQTLPTPIGSENIPLYGKVQGSFQLGVPAANGANGVIRWEEDRLTGVPQYGFLRVSDGINPPQYSTGYPYSPTPILTGSVKIAADNGAKAPAQEMVVFVDTNTNGRRDNGEPFNITDSQGVFSFYSLNPGQKYQIGVELPGGAKFRAAGAGADLSDPLRQVTVDQDANPEFLLENLGAIYTGRAVIDSNGNAAVDPTDQGAGNVELRLSIAKGSETRDLTTITNNSGLYLFEIPEGWRSVGRPKLGKSQPELGVFVPDVSIQNPTGLPLPDNAQAQPKLIQDDIIAGKVLTITLDGLSQNQLTTFFRQLPAAFVRLKAGDFNAVSLQLFGFKLLIDTFELYGPNTNGLSGLKYASGWAFFGDNGSGQPNQVRFTLGDRKTGGLAIKDGKLQGFQLSLDGSIRVAGVDIGVTGMNARFDAGQLPDGSDGYFQLTGKGTFGYGDYELVLALVGEGLIIDANGLRTLSGTVTGSIPIAGQQVELGTLGMVYDRVDDSLLFTGSTQWTMLGDKVEGNYFGLDHVALKIGLGKTTDKQAGVRSLSATLAGGFKVGGVDFDVSQLSFAWLPASDAFSISGKSTLRTDNGLLALTAELPGQGMVFSQAGLTLNAKVNGSLKLGDTGYTVSVTDSGLSYADGKLGFRFQGGLTTAGTDKDGKATSEELVSVTGTANFLNGALDSITGEASGKAGLPGAVVQFTDVGLAWDKTGGEVVIGGEAQLSLLQEGKSNRVLTIEGEFSLAGGRVTSAAGSVQAAEWQIAPGFSLTLDNLAFEFSAPDRKYRLQGSCEAEILGVTVGVGISDPGLVWRDGAFESFGGNLTGEWGADLDGNGVKEFDLSIQQMGFLYEVNPWRVTITGGGMLTYKGAVMAGGGVTTDDRGIIFGANGLEHLGFRGTLAFLYGDPFDDKNGNFVRESTENYTDRDGNGKYTSGIGIVIANAGVSYTPAAGTTPFSLKVTGMGRLAFEQGNLAEQPDIGLSIDLTKDGIEIVDGELKNFSVVLGASFRIAGLGFDPSGAVGMRYLADTGEWDLFGTVNATIGKKGYGLALGTSLDNPGIRWVNGSITQVNVGITGDATLGGVTVKFADCGLTWDGAKEAFSVFGSVSLKVGTEVTVGLGTRSAPGLVIRNNDWELNGLEFALKDLNLGGFEVTNARLGFSKSEQGFAAWGSALVRVNTVSLGGSFRFANGVLEEIAITARPMIPIYGPIILSEVSGSIRNLNFKDLSGVVFSATVGLQLLPYEIDMRDLPVVGGYFGKVTVAQLRGTATISPSNLRLQADMHLAASETIVDGKSTWKGLAGQGTAAVNLDWSKKDYYADVDLTLAGNPALPVVGMILDTRFRGRMNFDGNQGGISIRAAASVQLSSLIPVIGGTELASANLFFNFYPEKKQLNMVVWGEANLVFWTQTVGLHIDFWNGKYSVLSDRDDVQNRLGSFGQKLSLGASAMAVPTAITTPMAMAKLFGGSSFSALAAPAPVHTYAGTSSPVPATEVTSGEYLARFRVDDQALRDSSSAWIQQVRLAVDPVPGIQLEPIAASFDPATGIGTVGMRVVALPGQYLPRGMVLSSTLTSTIALAGVRNRAPGDPDEPDMDASWTQAFAYTGTLPAVGTDMDGSPIGGLDVTRVKYTVSFRPRDTSARLPDDWVDSVRVYADPLPGTTLQVAPPAYDHATGFWSVVLTYKPVGLTTIGSKFINQGLTGGITIRSKVELAGSREDAMGDVNSPDIHAAWWSAPSEIDAPLVPSAIDTSPRVTTLSGRVHDPRFKEVTVNLFYSTDEAGEFEYVASRPDGSPAMDIPVQVRPDGTWSVDVLWDPRQTPNTDLWLYGWVKDDGPNPPIYGDSTPFSVRFDVEGKITLPGAANAGVLSSLPVPAPNILVFADLDNDGIHEDTEPFSFSDATGRYRIDLPEGVTSSSLVFTVPGHYAAEAQTPAVRLVDITRGPVTADLSLVATRNILRGYVRVEGTKGLPVPLQVVQAYGSDGQVYQAITGMDGLYEIPVGQAGLYEVRLPDGEGSFEGFRTKPRGESYAVTITDGYGGSTTINLIQTLHVESVGLVTMRGENAQGTLAKLVDQANEGLVNAIEFDDSLRGATLDVVGRKSFLAPPYMLWDSKLRQWTYVPEKPALLSGDIREETTPYGLTAFRVRQDTRIDGGDLGISLRGDGLSRAFYVAPDVRFKLSNLGLENFAAFGSAGQSGISSTTDRSTGGGGGGAGLGGAILNFGFTTLDHVVFADNRASGGDGGDTLLPAYSSYLYKVATGGLPGGSKGGFAGVAGSGGGYLAGTPGAPIPVTLTYTLGNDPTPRAVTVMIAAGGGGGSGLGGAIYNAPGAILTIGAGTTFSGNSASGGKGGVGSPEYIANLANALFGDSARTLSVTGFEAWEQSQGTDGAGLGGAIFNDGGTLRLNDSAFQGNSSTDAGAALYALKGSTVINTSAFRDNSSGRDSGVRFEGGNLNQGILELNRSMVLAGGNDPKALVATGGRRFGEGNIVSSQTGFAWGVLASSVVARPDSPFTGKPYIPASDGAPVAFGAPVTFSTDTRLQANPRQPFYITTTVSNPAGVGVPGGRVLLGLAGQPVGEGRLNADGSVSVAAPGLKAGRYSFDVYYEGDSVFAGGLGKTSVTVGTPTERIVEELYETHLGRESDANGLKAWSARIDGGLSVEDAVRAFRYSTEAGLKTVERAYQDLLNRLPDQVGRDNWLRFLQTGKTERDLRAQVLASREYTGGHTREEVINRLYETYFGREADSAGMANWLARWDAGVDANTIARAIGSSNEAREVVVDELYQQILAREADQVGRRVWAGALASGLSQDQVEERLLTSNEFTG